jgi:hypothetical protein
MTYRHSIGLLSSSLLASSLRSPSSNQPPLLNLETDLYDASTGLIRKGLAQLFGWNSIAHSWIKSKKPNRSLLVFQYSWTEHPFGVELGAEAGRKHWIRNKRAPPSKLLQRVWRASVRSARYCAYLLSMLARRTDDTTHRQQHKTPLLRLRRNSGIRRDGQL